MVFCGAESGSTDTLARMNKGGTAAAELTLELARRMKSYDIVPEFSFVVGNPPDPEGDLRDTLAFIRRVKRINPATEIILYVYSPVPEPASLDAADRVDVPVSADAGRMGERSLAGILAAPRSAHTLVAGRDPAARPELRDGPQRLLSDRDRHAPDARPPGHAARRRRRGAITCRPAASRSSSTCCSACSTISVRRRRGFSRQFTV